MLNSLLLAVINSVWNRFVPNTFESQMILLSESPDFQMFFLDEYVKLRLPQVSTMLYFAIVLRIFWSRLWSNYGRVEPIICDVDASQLLYFDYFTRFYGTNFSNFLTVNLQILFGSWYFVILILLALFYIDLINQPFQRNLEKKQLKGFYANKENYS